MKCPRWNLQCMSTFVVVLYLFLVLLSNGGQVTAQDKFSDSERDRDRQMLMAARDELVRHYFDPAFRGVNVDEKFKTADELIKKVSSNSEAFYLIAAFMRSVDDSHTNFFPPSRAVKIEYGWKMQMIGDKCYVVAVRPDSLEATDGLKLGDQILRVERFEPSRDDFWKMKYLFYTLNPMSEFNLIIQSTPNAAREVLVHSKRIEGPAVTDLTVYSEYMNAVRAEENQQRMSAHRFAEFGDDLIIWKMPQFDLLKEKVDDYMGKVVKHKALILDLRGNGGGSEETLLRLLGYFTQEDLKVGDVVRRKETKPMVAKSMDSRVFKGKLVVLIDSESASASEVFARTIQLQKRGTILGDRSAGEVMRSIFYPRQVGIDTRVVFYGVSVTDADLILPDGQRLEKVGVTPDELLLPTMSQIQSSQDPVLSKAASLAGVELSPAKAGSLFPIVWK